ncbi:hypothetical protein AAA799P11_00598 [Marine Group I thaumarchaeote SCGC AAA799-P11]|uniref:Uncharacterized protein n=1 Tax=Marine Group I thaumarchaeote SCGC AAA799-P11 TaxID=1502295 RepID=A0A087S1K5_9ARCH|nr:hypothetical protein AAA799P11_00598 [Marine Group I thaumarchaeote SCGC AAA799-P11]
MSNLLQCLTRKKTITSEESRYHKCKPIIRKHRIIQASSFSVVEDDDGTTNVMINGFDNVGYVFEIKEPNIVPIELSTYSDQPIFDSQNNQPQNGQNPKTILL